MEPEQFENRLVTYTLEVQGRFYVIEHVPARVSRQTGEQFFAPETVEKIQQIISAGAGPKRFIETPVFEFAP
jgi:hypothetical protein